MKTRTVSVFGAVDGLVMFLGLTLGLIVAKQSTTAVWHAALGGAAGELVGMTVGQHLSSPEDGWLVSLACGVSGALACIIPGVPFLFLPRYQALTVAIILATIVAGIIAWMRPEKGVKAITRTYGILIGAGILSGLTGLILCIYGHGSLS